MVLRTFFAISHDNLVVSDNPNGGPAIGSSIINNVSTPNGTEFTYSSGGGTSITIDDTGGDPDIFEDQLAGSHTVVDGGGLVANGQSVESESIIELRALDDTGTPTGPVITVYVFSEGAVSADVWGFASTVPLEDGVSYVKVGGNNAGSSTYTDYITCFGPGTQILTETGEVAVENLAIGHKVRTRANGYQPIRWIGHATVAASGKMAPVVFALGAIGNTEELVVSPEHRIYVRGMDVEVLFGVEDALVAAKHLCGLPGVSRRESDEITYIHFMCDAHQIIQANGVDCESFFLSDTALSGLEAGPREELLTLFPSLEIGLQSFGNMAAIPLKSYEANLLRARMAG